MTTVGNQRFVILSDCAFRADHFISVSSERPWHTKDLQVTTIKLQSKGNTLHTIVTAESVRAVLEAVFP